MSRPVNVAIIGHKFMGKAHSHAWKSAGSFFDLGLVPNLKVACGQNHQALKDFAKRWGWEEIETDWRKVVTRKDIEIVDISVPTFLHHEIAVEAARAGKHIFCEKPLAINSQQAKEMLESAERGGVVHYLNHNYRRCPAVALAKQLIEDGKVGRIFHWRGAYLQSWIVDPAFPLTWHLRKEKAGAGPHFDLNSHSVDLARYLVGEIRTVLGLVARFIRERPFPEGGTAAAFQAGHAGKRRGEVTVEDAAFMMTEFENGALGSFEATRFASGRKNYNYFEIYGSRGSLIFNLDRMNELEYYSLDDPDPQRGFRTILATEPTHPYVGNWWPPGHIIGYEHTFTHAVADFLKAVEKGTLIQPNFHDGVRTTEVLEAGLESAMTGCRVTVKTE